jgi:hypothetical protein
MSSGRDIRFMLIREGHCLVQDKTRHKGGRAVTGWVWAGIFIGLAIVILAVGIPYLLTHKGMHSADAVAEVQEYLRAKRRWRQWQGPRPGQPDRAASRRDTP